MHSAWLMMLPRTIFSHFRPPPKIQIPPPKILPSFMKTFILFVATLLFSAYVQGQGSLKLQMSGFKNDKGQAAILLFKDNVGYPDKSNLAYKTGFSGIKDGTSNFIFQAIPAGNYAVVVLHDENLNKKMDYNMLGMPNEGFGVSNNAVGAFWQIKPFDQAKIAVGKTEVTHKLTIGY